MNMDIWLNKFPRKNVEDVARFLLSACSKLWAKRAKLREILKRNQYSVIWKVLSHPECFLWKQGQSLTKGIRCVTPGSRQPSQQKEPKNKDVVTQEESVRNSCIYCYLFSWHPQKTNKSVWKMYTSVFPAWAKGIEMSGHAGRLQGRKSQMQRPGLTGNPRFQICGHLLGSPGHGHHPGLSGWGHTCSPETEHQATRIILRPWNLLGWVMSML